MEGRDQALAQRWRDGDNGALSLVAERYTGALGAIAYNIVRDASLAEDVVQETFVRASKKIHTLEDTEKLGGFLSTIARNVATDMVRQRASRVLNGTGPAAPRTPEREAAIGELGVALTAAVDRLPQDQRELFLMKYISGMRYGEIARALQMSNDAVGQKLWRIRQKLQHDLEEFKP